MTTFVAKVKSGLEWLEHGHLIVQILIGLGAGTIVRAILLGSTKIPTIWITPIWLLASGFTIALLVYVGKKIAKRRTQKSSTQDASMSPGQFQNVDEFYRTYDNALLLECEDNIKKVSVNYEEGVDRERFLIRLLATGVVTFFFEIAWSSIFSSQIKALEKLNKGGMRVEDLQPLYEEAAMQYPDIYKKYSFDGWCSFLIGQILMRKDGSIVTITVRGREFLKYLIQSGRSASDRSF